MIDSVDVKRMTVLVTIIRDELKKSGFEATPDDIDLVLDHALRAKRAEVEAASAKRGLEMLPDFVKGMLQGLHPKPPDDGEAWKRGEPPVGGA